MEITIQQLAKAAGTTSRTLRHYDSVGLVSPSRIGSNGYRYYDDRSLVRLQRVLLLRELGLGLDADAAFQQIIPNLPADFRPLLGALVQENNELLMRVHHRSRQNHVLLCRSLELMSRLLGSLLPGGGTVYTGKGDVLGSFGPARSTYQAVG